ncbi:MAG: carbonic anhydrase [Deferribacterota bacterium]|nr:carbonic anhydrase [Deferribacterota bacterium]
MGKAYDHIVSENKKYAVVFDKAGLATQPAKKIAILTCMDARLDPMRFAGLELGDAHIIRNAGGRASDDAIRSLVISNRLLGTDQWFVIHHSDCGMESFTQKKMDELLAENLNAKRAVYGRFMNWLTIDDRKKSVIDDVLRIKGHPLVPDNVSVFGFIFDLKTGELIEVEEASRAGKSSE